MRSVFRGEAPLPRAWAHTSTWGQSCPAPCWCALLSERPSAGATIQGPTRSWKRDHPGAHPPLEEDSAWLAGEPRVTSRPRANETARPRGSIAQQREPRT